ncbi:MAG TPA: PDZ domain-containing protein [Planktothrix sp.]|jgi:hypothetical protein
MKRSAARFAALLAISIATVLPASAGFIGFAMQEAPKPNGVEIALIKPGGPADQAGIQPGDIVSSINGIQVHSAAAVTRMIAAMHPNETAQLALVRNGAPININVVIGSLDGAAAPPSPQPPSSPLSPPSPGKLQIEGYVRQTDPIETAFNVEVPSGWNTVLGMARRSALQINPFVRTLSPDKMTYLMMGEPTMPSFTPPSRMGNRIGNREGTFYNNGLGGWELVLRYLPGPQFAKAYGETMLKGMCPNLTFVGSEERPDLAEKAKAIFPPPTPSRYDGGEAQFTCTHHGRPMEVKVEVATIATLNNLMWGVVFVRAYLTPHGYGDQAEQALVHMGRSMQFNPVWSQMQSNIDKQSAFAIKAQMDAFFQKERGFIDKLNSVDESFEAMDEIVSGYSTYKDATTGNTYSLSNTSPYKWYDESSGRIISTDSDAKPFWAPGLRALPRVSQ